MTTSTESNTLTEQQLSIVKLLETGKNVFVTGSAGTGKSFLFRHIFQQFPQESTQMCSMTGVSTVLLNVAIPYAKATTLHSWSGIGLCNTTRDRIIQKVIRNRRQVDKWRKTKLLMIDEVSMMSAYVLETIEEIARIIRKNPFPFGGIQLVFSGDMFQLPPIGGEGLDNGAFCFESPIWSTLFGGNLGKCIELSQVFRQTDDAFVNLLNEIRWGQISEESVSLLRSRVGLPGPTDEVMTKLFPRRINVQQINATEYGKLETEEMVFSQVVRKNTNVYLEDGRAFDEFDQIQCQMATDEILQRECIHFQSLLPCVETLRLKIGTIVMCLANLSVEEGIVNGSQGRVDSFVGGFPVVVFTNGATMKMSMHWWQNSSMPCISIGQIPLVLSWATTIHKSQGMTLTRAEMDLGNQLFEYGQAYVALSRVKSLDGLYLTHFNPYKIKANPKVLNFYASLKNE